MKKQTKIIWNVGLILGLLLVLFILEQVFPSGSMLFTVLKKGAIYALVAVSMNLLNGFTGKTVIHPNQIPVVNEMLRVSQRDYADARAILNWDTGSGSLVSASEDGGRMNEYNTHSRWARRIVLRAERYGVRA